MKKFVSILLGASSTLALAATASAQTATGIEELEEIVVTAQRRSESITDVPIAITVATAAQLESQGITKMEDLGRISPAVQVSATGAFIQPSIRGVTSALAGTFENNVGMYIDGVYYPITRALNVELANISQVQVLKGPQGTLFGRNSTGGALLIDTLNPSMNELVARVGVGYYSFNDRRAQGYLSLPILSDTLAINFAGYKRKSDGYITDSVSGIDMAPIDNSSISSKLRWEPIENLALQLKHDHTELSDARGLAVTSEVCEASPGAPCPPTSGIRNPLAATNYVETRDNLTSHTFAPIFRTKVDTTALDIEYNLGWTQLNGLASYQEEDDMGLLDRDYVALATPFNGTISFDKSKTITADFNLTSVNPGPLQYVVGVYYYDSDSATGSFTNDPRTLRQAYKITAEAYAVYADLTWEAVSNLFLTVGARYNHEERTALVTGPTGLVLNTPSATNAFAFVNNATFVNTTPRVVVRYQLGDDSNVYASVTRGSRSGALAISNPFNLIRPEEITAYEVGYKTQQGRIRFDTSVYYYDFKDLQVSTSTVVGTTVVPLTENAPSAEVYGAEFQISAEVVENFNVGLGGAYTQAEFKEFTNNGVNGINPGPGVNTGLNVTDCDYTVGAPFTVCSQNFAGKKLVRAPEWTGNLSADYTLHMLGKWVPSANVSYSSKYLPTRGDLYPNGKYRYEAPAYTLVNMRLAWSPSDESGLTIAAVGQNVFDERTYIYRTGSAAQNGGGGDVFALATPQTWGVQVDYRF